eukprot:TRINITY_DN6610_c1_g1_i1.p1 TRINITY_DN6610_c1_g1~~TRINITY_DN6610_c1_g1_i1.p1  ORF type:complete len:228 (+),score=54.99 TRINITY_DN6610_c1_g1_i1:745-1428(+)
MNDAMSMGVHRLWKDHFVQKLHPVPGVVAVDVAGGTGDITFRIIDQLRKKQEYSVKKQSKITVVDINPSMIQVGRERAQELGYTTDEVVDIDFQVANAEKMPFEDNSVDMYTIAFGIRNCTNVDKVLNEAYRILKPGGRFMCLEFSKVTPDTLRKLYDLYSFNIIPPMGQVLASDYESYQYLVESIRKFPPQDDFAQMIRDAGYSFVSYEDLNFGIVAIHSGFKLSP